MDYKTKPEDSVNRIMKKKSWIVGLLFHTLLLVAFPLGMFHFEKVTAIGILLYDVFLICIIICRTFEKETIVELFFSWTCILPLLSIVYVADWKYYFFDEMHRTILLVASFVIAFIIVSLVKNFYKHEIKAVMIFLLFLLISFSLYGQAIFLNSSVHLENSTNVAFELKEKEDYPDKGGLIDTYTLELTPVHSTMKTEDRCELKYFSVNKDVYENADPGNVYEFLLHKGLFHMEYFDKTEVLKDLN